MTRGPLPYPDQFPEKYDPSGYFHNPGGTLPFPMPQNTPAAAWTSGDIAFAWVVPVGGGLTTTWVSPLFDFRPEFRGGDGRRPLAQPVHGRSTGAGAYLWLQVSGLTSAIDVTNTLNVTTQEFSHVYDSEQVVQTSPTADISTYFIGGQPSALVPLQPPGAGYPVRFWRASITLAYATAPAALPAFTLFAAVY